MTLHYSNLETGTSYTKEVVSITYHVGKLFLILKDDDGKEYTTTYTQASLESGMLSIF